MTNEEWHKHIQELLAIIMEQEKRIWHLEEWTVNHVKAHI